MAVKLDYDIDKYPFIIQDHLHKRMKERKMTLLEIVKMGAWSHSVGYVPDLTEAPAGWFKRFPTFTLLGEGQYIKTVYTRHMEQGGLTPHRKGIVDWDVWSKRKISHLLGRLLDRILAGHTPIPEESSTTSWSDLDLE
jgi:hypothetical protein